MHLDAAEGMLTPEHVTLAVATVMRAPVSATGGVFPASRRAEVIEDAARQSIADLVGADPRGVVLGPGPAVMLRRLAEALSETWNLGDHIVLTKLDDCANVTPWLHCAQARGVDVRWAEIEIDNCELPSWQFRDLIGHSTELVAITAASGTVGTRPDVAAIAERAGEHGALMVVDASMSAPFEPQDIETLGADVMALSATAWGGPPVGALVFRNPALLDRLSSVSLENDARGPRRLELGPHSYPLLAGLTASVDHLAGLDTSATGTRRERVLRSMTALQSYQSELLGDLLLELSVLPCVTVVGHPERRVPLLSFTHSDVKANDVVAHLAEQGVCAFADPGDQGVLAQLGSSEVGGVVRIGLAHYTTRGEIDALVTAVSQLG
ncbi:MAG: cysteine desulfurase family protein [Pseudonocardia sp.]|nr:cysteine desulfurase family protein [Pseudonocardia sp.]